MPFPAIIPLPIPVTTFATAISLNFAKFTTDASRSSYTVVTKIPAAYFAIDGSSCRLRLVLPKTAGTITNIYIGQVATSGNAYDFDGNQVEVRFAGASGVTWLASSAVHDITSDEVSFPITGTSAIIIAFNIGTTTTIMKTTTLAFSSSTGDGIPAYSTGDPVISYYHSALSEAGTTSKTASYTVVKGACYGAYFIQAGNGT